MHKSQSLINHVALVLDGSSSMAGHQAKLVSVADEQIRYLALRSEELNQETRVSVYLFADNVECLIFDMDVMRLPSIEDLYKVNGMTALVDAVAKSQSDLTTTSQLYGDHAFLTFVLTDGHENRSRLPKSHLTSLTNHALGNWTLAFLVPDKTSQAVLARHGVHEGNIAVWDTQSATGIVDAAKTIRQATDTFMTNRASGIRGTRNLFSTGIDAVNESTVKSNLVPLQVGTYKLLPVNQKIRIDDFFTRNGMHYSLGHGYYELSKTEDIQDHKDIIVVDKVNGQAYGGREARDLIGLPHTGTAHVRPTHNPKYKIFVQSTAYNRNLVPNTEALVRV